MEKKFIDGLSVSPPHGNAPDFVKAKGGIKRESLILWLQKQEDVWINFQVKVSKKGNWYCEVDDWKPEGERSAPAERSPEQVSKIINQGMDDDLPF